MDNLIALCVCDSVCFVHGCTCASNNVVHRHECVRATRYRVGIRVRAFIYVMITRASQIHGVLINDMLPVGILVTLVTQRFDKSVKTLRNILLFCTASFIRSLVCAEINSH